MDDKSTYEVMFPGLDEPIYLTGSIIYEPALLYLFGILTQDDYIGLTMLKNNMIKIRH